jgi:hypothetical protein
MPTLDHVVINTRDRMDEAAALYERLGFVLTPRGHHTLGTINHLAIFGTEYLELVGVDPAKASSTQTTSIMGFPIGLNGLVFGTDDSLGVHKTLSAAGVPVADPVEFSRPVVLPGLTEDAKFRVVRVRPEAAPYGRVYFCHHFTRHMVWRDEWRHHPNGVLGVERAVIAAAAPDKAAGLYRTMFGADALRTGIDGVSVLVGLSRFDIATPKTLAAAYGAAAPDPQGRDSYMAALTFRCASVERAADVLRKGGIAHTRHARGLVIAARDGFGAMLEFVA